MSGAVTDWIGAPVWRASTGGDDGTLPGAEVMEWFRWRCAASAARGVDAAAGASAVGLCSVDDGASFDAC